MKIFNIFKISASDKRTALARKNIFATVLLKGIDMLVYLLLVPATLGYLNPYEYGIWLTISSVLGWINSFDVGLGNGLRNQLTQALANNDYNKARALITTTLVILSTIITILILISCIVFPYINFYNLFNVNQTLIPNLNQVISITFFIFCINFILKIIGNVYLALQLPAVNYALSTGGHLLSLLIIIILTHTTESSLLSIAIVYSISPTIVYLIAFPVTFLGKYKILAPSLYSFKKKYISSILSLGFQFFLLQISSIVLFSMTNLIISHNFGPDKVTEYNVAFRLFYLVVNFTMLILGPMWSATTDAYEKGEINWIERSIKKIRKLLILVGIGLIVLVVISKQIYYIWVGNEVFVPLLISTGVAIYVYILIWSQTYSSFLNGMGKLRIQMINTILMAIIFYPLCILFKNLGIFGVILAMCLVNLSGLVLNAYQFKIVINRKAKGIWNK